MVDERAFSSHLRGNLTSTEVERAFFYGGLRSISNSISKNVDHIVTYNCRQVCGALVTCSACNTPTDTSGPRKCLSVYGTMWFVAPEITPSWCYGVAADKYYVAAVSALNRGAWQIPLTLASCSACLRRYSAPTGLLYDQYGTSRHMTLEVRLS